MGLKPHRTTIDTTQDWFMNEAATRGGIASVSTTGSGVSEDQAEQLVTYRANPSGVKPVGLLLNDMVDIDLTRQRKSYEKDEVVKGEKVTLLRKGTVVTNMIYPSQTPTGGAIAYVGHSGYIASTDVASDSEFAAANREVGRFESSKDEDGYCKVTINLPQ